MICEIIFIFFLIPILLLPITKGNFILLILMCVCCFCLFVLLKIDFRDLDKQFEYKIFFIAIKTIVIRCVVITIVLFIILLLFYSEILFFHPLNAKSQWLQLFWLYPLFSVIPQELLFRTFLFKRYQILLPNINHRVVLSCIAFSFLHIIFLNWEAVVLSFLASIIFCRTYIIFKSILLVIIEHSILGLLTYSVGFGYFFDSAFINLL